MGRMGRMGSVQVSVVAFLVMLAYYWKVEYDSEAKATVSTSTDVMEGKPILIHHQNRQMRRESYQRHHEHPLFGIEETESRINNHNNRNRAQGGDGQRHHRPVQKHIKKSSYPSSIKSSTSLSTKKSSKRGANMFTVRPSSMPSVLPTTLATTQTPTTIPTASMIPSTIPSVSDAPSQSPSRFPTTPNPTRPSGITNAPTAERSFAIEAPTYSLFFFFDDTTGNIQTTDEDFIQLGEVTRVFLDDYFDNRYGNTVIITFNQALTEVVGFTSVSLPIQTFFLTTALYSETSIFYPPGSEVEREIEKAFTTFGSNFEYLMSIRGLPTTNPFQSISSVNWGGYGTG